MTIKKIKDEFKISLGKDVQTECFPIAVATALDVLMKSDGYKRVPKSKTAQGEFIWSNKKGEQLTIGYYTQVDSINFSSIFSKNKTPGKEDVKKTIEALYNKLNTTIGAVSQYLGSPYISSTRDLRMKIVGRDPEQKAQLIVPIIKNLYSKIEGVQRPYVDIIEQTHSLIQFLFSPVE